jgi:hypothetical protein
LKTFPLVSGHIQSQNFVHISFRNGKAVMAVRASHMRRAPKPGGVLQISRGRLRMPNTKKLTHLGFQVQPTTRPIVIATQIGTIVDIKSAQVSNTAGLENMEYASLNPFESIDK